LKNPVEKILAGWARATFFSEKPFLARAFVLQEPAFARQAGAVAAESAVRGDDPVAGDDDGDGGFFWFLSSSLGTHFNAKLLLCSEAGSS
jgi:hypothetical protein